MTELPPGDVPLCDYLGRRDPSAAAREIIAGLRADPRSIPSRYFYDERGSRLFEEITRLPEYYPTRTEKSILRENASRLVGGADGLTIVELGSGDCSKVSILLDAVPGESLESVRYMPVDVSRSALARSAGELIRSYPGLSVVCLRDDFRRCPSRIPADGKRLILFLGSTIGNLRKEEAAGLLSALAGSMDTGDRLLLGLDMLKQRRVLERAYNDSKGITAHFNRNILRVANRIAKTDFRPEQFVHRAFLNGSQSSIEMHLEAARTLSVESPLLDGPLSLSTGERIHTETSRKYSSDDIGLLAGRAGLALSAVYSDRRGWFSLAEMVPG